MPLRGTNPGLFDRRATLREPSATRNGVGESVDTWADVAIVWAGWLPESGREFRAAQAKWYNAAGVLRIRYRADVRTTWRVYVDGILYDIKGRAEQHRRCFLDLVLEETHLSSTSASYITDEAGDAITDEAGNPITDT